MTYRDWAWACVLAGGLAASEASATTPIMGSTNAWVSTSISLPRRDEQDWQATPHKLTPFALSSGGNELQSVVADQTVVATWESADVGRVILDWGWDVWNGDSQRFALDIGSGHGAWSYLFEADADGWFDLAWTVSARGQISGLRNIRAVGDLGSALLVGNSDDPVSSGSLSIPLIAGRTYFVGLDQTASLQGTDPMVSGRARGEFTWRIRDAMPAPTIPEPASWALLIAGFGVVGAALRRRAITTPQTA